MNLTPTRVARASLAVLVLLAACVAKPGGQPPLPPRASPACAEARTQRARVAGLLAQGKLHRALLVIGKANEMCPGEAPITWGAEVTALAEIGRAEMARALAQRIEAADHADAKPSAERALQLLAQQAADPSQRDAEALCDAGMQAKRNGDLPRAQRLFDRAIEVGQRARGSAVIAEMRPTFRDKRDYNDGYHAVAWSPDGRTLAANDGGDVLLFDTRTWQPRRRLIGSSGWIGAIAFSADGARIAAGSDAGWIRIWDIAAETAPAVVDAAIAVSSLAFSQDGRRLAAAGYGPWLHGDFTAEVRLWSLPSGTAAGVLKDARGPVAFSADGQVLATGDKLWDARSLTPVERKRANESAVPRNSPPGETTESGISPETESAVSPDGKTTATWQGAFGPDAFRAGVLRLTSERNDVSARILDPQAIVYQLAFSPDGNRLAEGSFGPRVRVWSVRSNEPPEWIGTDRAPFVNGLAISPDGGMLATVSDDNLVRAWNIANPGAPRIFRVERPSEVDAVAFSSDGRTLAWRTPDWERPAAIWLWTVGASASPKEYRDESTVRSPDGNTVASWEDASVVRLRPATGGKGSSVLVDDRIVCSPDGQTLASVATRWGAVAFWKRQSSDPRVWPDCANLPAMSSRGPPPPILETAPTATMKAGGLAVAFSPDGRLFFAADDGGAVRLWRLPDYELAGSIYLLADDPTASVFLTFNGYFEAIGNTARQYLICRIGSDMFPIDLCQERFEVAGLPSKVLAGDHSYIAP